MQFVKYLHPPSQAPPTSRPKSARCVLAGPVSLAEGSEAWLPVVPLANSGGRRALYATVALSPQLVPLEQDEVEAAREHLHKVGAESWVGAAWGSSGPG